MVGALAVVVAVLVVVPAVVLGAGAAVCVAFSLAFDRPAPP